MQHTSETHETHYCNVCSSTCCRLMEARWREDRRRRRARCHDVEVAHGPRTSAVGNASSSGRCEVRRSAAEARAARDVRHEVRMGRAKHVAHGHEAWGAWGARCEGKRVRPIWPDRRSVESITEEKCRKRIWDIWNIEICSTGIAKHMNDKKTLNTWWWIFVKTHNDRLINIHAGSFVLTSKGVRVLKRNLVV
jgi:hypothetical protein